MPNKVGRFLQDLGSGLNPQVAQSVGQQRSLEQQDRQFKQQATLGFLQDALKNPNLTDAEVNEIRGAIESITGQPSLAAKAPSRRKRVTAILDNQKVPAILDEGTGFLHDPETAERMPSAMLAEKQGRGGYTTLQDYVDANGDIYKVPFDHRAGVWKWDQKQRVDEQGRIVGAPRSVKDPSVQGDIASAKQSGKTEAKLRTESKVDLPTVLNNSRRLKTIVRSAIAHPGFTTVVGAPSPGKLTQFVGGTDAAGFRAIQKQIEGGAFKEAFETLKGGGQITEIEGEKATRALLRLDTALSEKEYKAAAEEFIQELEKLEDIARERAGRPSIRTKLKTRGSNNSGIKFLGFE